MEGKRKERKEREVDGGRKERKEGEREEAIMLGRLRMILFLSFPFFFFNICLPERKCYFPYICALLRNTMKLYHNKAS